MPKKIQIAAVLLIAARLSAAEKRHDWESAKVISQDLASTPVGAYAAPIGTATVAVPIYRRTNIVVVETGTYRLEWSEVWQRKPIILAVNRSIQFYREGDWFIVLDSRKKKHKFALIGMTAIGPAATNKVK